MTTRSHRALRESSCVTQVSLGFLPRDMLPTKRSVERRKNGERTIA